MAHERDPILLDVFAACGNASQLAKSLGVTRQAVFHWTKVPMRYLKLISEMTGIPRAKLRPDLYD